MKGLKKLALAAAVAAVPFAAQADLKALDDTSMGNVTGQAGVTIELETKVDIGTFTYTDEGSFAVSGIHIGGGAIETDADGNVSGVSGLLDDLKIDIDVQADGDAFIHVGSVSGGPIDFAVGVESASLVAADGSESTLLASNIGITGLLAQLDLRVDTATDTLITDVAFNVTDMDMDVDFLGIGIRDMTITGGDTFGAAYAGTSTSPYAGLFATAQLTIGKATGVAGSASGEALAIGVPEFIADVSIGATEIGGTSIGVISMDNLAITQTNMKIYGH